MRTFGVYKKDGKGYEAVARGFSLWAFLIPALWLLYKRLWAHAISMAVVFLLVYVLFLGALNSGADLLAAAFVVAYLGLSVMVGFFGNGWVERNLVARGYRKIDELLARSAVEAVRNCSDTEERFGV